MVVGVRSIPPWIPGERGASVCERVRPGLGWWGDIEGECACGGGNHTDLGERVWWGSSCMFILHELGFLIVSPVCVPGASGRLHLGEV